MSKQHFTQHCAYMFTAALMLALYSIDTSNIGTKVKHVQVEHEETKFSLNLLCFLNDLNPFSRVSPVFTVCLCCMQMTPPGATQEADPTNGAEGA